MFKISLSPFFALFICWMAMLDACEDRQLNVPITIGTDTLSVPVTYQDGFFRLLSNKEGTQFSAVAEDHDFATDFRFQDTYKRFWNTWQTATGEDRIMMEAYNFLTESCDYFESIADSLTGVPYMVIKAQTDGLTISGGNSSNFIINIKLSDASRIIVYHESIHAYMDWRNAGGTSWWTRAINEGVCDVMAVVMEYDLKGSSSWEIDNRNGAAYRKLHQPATYPMATGGLPHRGGRILGYWAYLLKTDFGMSSEKIGELLLEVVNKDLPTQNAYTYPEVKAFTLAIAAECIEDCYNAIDQAWQMVGVP